MALLISPSTIIPGLTRTTLTRHCRETWNCDIYHYITSEGYGLALTITNLTSRPLPTFLNLVSPKCILKTPAHHLTTNDGKNICMIVKNQYYYYRREILLAWIYFLLNMVVICSLYRSTLFPMYLVLK